MTDRFDDGPTDPHIVFDPDQRQELHRDVTGDELVAAVYANPDNDEPRLVYGDYLLERDDPRGEFIQLQLARHASGAPATAAEQQLLTEHVEAWTTPLYDAIELWSIEFARGFLSSCRAKDNTIFLRDAIGHPRWLTVEELVAREASLVTHPCLRSLRRITTSTEALGALAGVTHPVKVEEARVDGVIRWPDDSYDGPRPRYPDRAWARIFEVGALVALRSLIVDGPLVTDEQATAALLRSKLGRQLTALTFNDDRCKLDTWDRVLREHPSLRRIAVRATSQDLRWIQDSTCFAVLARDEHGACHASVEIGEAPPASLADMLLTLPSDYRTLAISTHFSAEQISSLTARLAQRFELM